ncbi:MAG: type II toxin-antitoxin system VapB family antitoxin [Gemmatimonadales bacterium]
MATDKITVTLDHDTLAMVREQAATNGLSVSAWLDRAARARLRAEGARQLAAFMGSDDGRDIAERMRIAAAARADAIGEGAA